MMHFEGLYVQNEYHAYMLRRIVMLKAEAEALAACGKLSACECPAVTRAAMAAGQTVSILLSASAQARSIEPGTTIPAAIVRV